jgi:bacillithiol system protein YtxJ
LIKKKKTSGITDMNWTALTDISQLASIKEKSHNYPIVIFKHSTSCSISAMALSRLERGWDESAIPTVEAYFLDLIAYRQISNAIADEFGIYHQSPQIMVISNGEVIYDDSHMGISFSSLKKTLADRVN